MNNIPYIPPELFNPQQKDWIEKMLRGVFAKIDSMATREVDAANVLISINTDDQAIPGNSQVTLQEYLLPVATAPANQIGA